MTGDFIIVLASNDSLEWRKRNGTFDQLIENQITPARAVPFANDSRLGPYTTLYAHEVNKEFFDNSENLQYLVKHYPIEMFNVLKYRYVHLARDTNLRLKALDDRNFQNAKGLRDANRSLASKDKTILSLKNEMKSLNSAIEKRNKTVKSQKETIVLLQNRPSQNKNEEEIKRLRKIIDEEKVKTKMLQKVMRSQMNQICRLKENDKTDEIEALRTELENLRDQNPDECSICCKNFNSKNNQKSCLSSCGHQFCNECLKKILDKHNSDCPTCRTGFGEEHIIKLF